MVRNDLRKRSGPGSKILGLLIVNIIPIAGLAWGAWMVGTGRASLDDLPEGIGRSAAFFGVATAALLIFASGLLPLFHGLARGMRGRLLYSAERRREGGAGVKFVEWLLWPFRALLYLIGWIGRFGALVVTLALILAAILFLVRFFEPDFLEAELRVTEHLETGLAWLRERFAR